MLVWHRRVGLVASIFILLLSLTGLALNHVADLDLDQRYVTGDWIVEHYGLVPDDTPVGFPAGASWFTWLGHRLFLDGREIAADIDRPRGAVALASGFAVATADAVILFTPRGELIERLTRASLPGDIEAIGRTAEGQLAVATPDGIHLADRQLLDWTPSAPSAGAPVWARQATPPPAQVAAVLETFRGRGIPVSRLLLDIHSGRILGRWGVWIADALAVGLVLLALTGVVNWLRSRR